MVEKKETMTVNEVAEVLGVDRTTVKNKVKELYPDLMQQGVTTHLTEEQATNVKNHIVSISGTLEKKFSSVTTKEIQ